MIITSVKLGIMCERGIESNTNRNQTHRIVSPRNRMRLIITSYAMFVPDQIF